MNLLAMDNFLEIVLGTELAPAGNATAQAQDFRQRSQRAFGMIWSSTEPTIRTILNQPWISRSARSLRSPP